MPNSSGDEADSRTASVGVHRPRANTSSARNSHDSDTRPAKKPRRNRSRTGHDVNDFVPRGASFSAISLQVDPDDTSSSGSSSDSSDDSGSDAPNTSASANPHAGSTAPAISWNQGRKNTVRTSLGKRKEQPQPDRPAAKQFKAVNGTYWRSRSASASSGASEAAEKEESEDSSGLEEGEVDYRSDSDDSVSLDSEADDSILLNIGPKGGGAADDYDPESLDLNSAHTNGQTNGQPNGKAAVPLLGAELAPPESKEDAFRRFSSKYPTAPTALVDLSQADFEMQARYLHWDRDINDIDLGLPVGCLECHGLGHLADVCPAKECIHCGVWNKHASSFCPSWRRCSRCRESGHREEQCSSPLKSSAAEVPCDFCGSSYHVESECDYQWKLPVPDSAAPNVTVSLSCARCISASHLIGDCPSLSRPLTTSSFTLQGIDPATITNLNVGASTGKPPPAGKPGPPNRLPRGKNRRGANIRSPSPDSDDMLPRGNRRPPPPPPNARGRGRGAARGAIRFGSGFGANQPRGGKLPPRPPFPGNNTRQRSLSPNRRPNRGPPPPRGGGGRGRGRGGKSRRAK